MNGLRLGGQGVYDLVNKVAVVAGCGGGIGAAAGPAIRRRWSDRGSRLPPGRCPGRSNHGGLAGEGHWSVQLPVDDTAAVDEAARLVGERH